MEHASEERPDNLMDVDHAFDDLLANNKKFAESFDQYGFDGIAHAGVLVVTCMDSRIVPLEMLGLTFGDAKILRTPGGHDVRTCWLHCRRSPAERQPHHGDPAQPMCYGSSR